MRSYALGKSSMRQVVIIGGGASGTIALIQCLRILPRNTHIIILEPSEVLGQGLAYSTQEDCHLLNVPVARMSIFPDKPHAFYDWLKSGNYSTSAFDLNSFVPRKLFAEYLASLVASLPEERYRHVRSRAQSVSRVTTTWGIETEDQSKIRADVVILATGYATQKETEPKIIQSHQHEKLSALKPNDTILILGTGLSAVDVILQLKKKGHTQFHCVSKHGHFPHPHLEVGHHQVVHLPQLHGYSPLQILRLIRSFERNQNHELLDVIHAVRLQAKKIWACWTKSEKKSFLTHLQSYWEKVRHRVPRSVFAEIQSDLSSGKIRVTAGKISGVSPGPLGLQVHFRKRGLVTSETEPCSILILASGAKINQSVKISFQGKSVRTCDFGFGFKNTPSDLWVIGPPAKTILWEITSIPDISVQVEQVVQEIALHLEGRAQSSLFTDHPRQADETYFEHFWAASQFGAILVKGALVAVIHGIFPFLLSEYLSDELRTCSRKLTYRRLIKSNRAQKIKRNRKAIQKAA